MEGKREFKHVPAKDVVPCSFLPERTSSSDKILASMKEDGIQQPLIVRPHPTNPELYEIIDGRTRRSAYKDDDLICVDIRYGVDDAEVFRISNMTFQRQAQNTYDRARFLAKWLMALKPEYGPTRGTQAKIARHAHLSESEVSQYLSISKMFTKLEELRASSPEAATLNFDALKEQGVNKLYELSRLVDNEVELVNAANELAANPEMSIHALRKKIEEIKAFPKESCVNSTIMELAYDDDEIEQKRRVKYNRVLEVTQQVNLLAGRTQSTLRDLELRLKMSEHESVQVEPILKSLEQLKRRFKRLEKDAKKLSGLVVSGSQSSSLVSNE